MDSIRVPRSQAWRTVLLIGLMKVGVVDQAAWPAETDQFYGRDIPLEDSRPLINAKVNQIIRKEVASWRGRPRPFRLESKIHLALDGWFAFGRLASWIEQDEEIAKIRARKRYIYHGLPVYRSLIEANPYPSPTIVVNGNIVVINYPKVW